MQVEFWAGFSKRRNSTKIPDVSGTSVECDFKQPVNYASPTLRIRTDGDFEWNYARIDDIFYYVVNKTSNPNGMWDVSLEIDYMGTHRDAILATTAYVEYYQGGSRAIPDNRLVPVTPSRSESQEVVLPGLVKTGLNYVVQTVGASGLGQHYLLTAAQMRALGNALYSADPAEVFDKWTTEYYTQAPESLIISVMVFPCNIESFTAYASETVKLGVWDSGVTGLRAYGTTAKSLVIAMAPPHGGYTDPDTPVDIRNYKPYTTLSVYLPYVGTVEIDPGLFFGARSGLTIEYSVSFSSGRVFYRLRSGEASFGEYSGQIAGGATIGGANINGPSSIPQDWGIAAALMEAGRNIPILGEAILGNLSSLLQQYGGTSGVATRGGGADLAEEAVTKSVCRLSVTTVDTTYAPGGAGKTIGIPYFRQATIGNLSGYVKCRGASASLMNYFGGAQQIVNNYMNGGFYVE